MCENAQWIAWAWSVAMWDIFIADGKEPDFDFGFTFDDDCQASYTSSAFLINPFLDAVRQQPVYFACRIGIRFTHPDGSQGGEF